MLFLILVIFFISLCRFATAYILVYLVLGGIPRFDLWIFLSFLSRVMNLKAFTRSLDIFSILEVFSMSWPALQVSSCFVLCVAFGIHLVNLGRLLLLVIPHRKLYTESQNSKIPRSQSWKTLEGFPFIRRFVFYPFNGII